MAKPSSKSGQGTKSSSKARSKASKSSLRHFWLKLRSQFLTLKKKIQTARSKHIHLHKSFRRSYREDYLRQTSTPGLLSHAMLTFKTIFSHWRIFLPLIALMVLSYIVAVGLMSEDFYLQLQTTIDESSLELAGGEIGNFAKAGLLLLSTVTTGGLNVGMNDTQIVFAILLFLILWLVTIFLLRQFFAGGQPKLRDALYNALAPLISTLIIFVVIIIQAIPIFLVIITYSAAIATNFLSTPFYALVYFIFAATMILLSCYLFSSSLLALVAVTAPGMYPFSALFAASDLAAGRRIRIVLRILYLILAIALIYIITMLPVILLDLWLKATWDVFAGWPIVSFFLMIVTCFVFIYATTYIYLYYRWLLDYKEK